MNSERKNYPMKEFWAIFSISSILVIRSGYAKKGQFSILAVFQNVWDLYKFGLQIWIQNEKNYPMKEFQAIFLISSILVIRSAYAKKGQFSILAVFQNVWVYINLGCRFEFRTQKLPYERISDNFSDFINLGHQVCEKRPIFNISCNSKYMEFT